MDNIVKIKESEETQILKPCQKTLIDMEHEGDGDISCN